MSDRLSLPLHPTLRDPRTGMSMRALGFLKNGRPVWPVMGASEGAPEVNGSNAGGAGETKTSESGGNAGSSSGGETTDDGRDPQKKINALEEEKNRHFKRAQETAAERDQLAAKLKEIEDKDKSELEKATGRVEELTAQNAQLQDQLRRLQIDNSFFVENSVAWHDPEDAKGFVLRELGEVEVDDKGRVKGLKDAIDKVAKAKPYLVKPETTGDGRPPASGQPPRKQSGNATDDDLRKRYPSLRR